MAKPGRSPNETADLAWAGRKYSIFRSITPQLLFIFSILQILERILSELGFGGSVCHFHTVLEPNARAIRSGYAPHSSAAIAIEYSLYKVLSGAPRWKGTPQTVTEVAQRCYC
jgi:hypothetical protein